MWQITSRGESLIHFGRSVSQGHLLCGSPSRPGKLRVSSTHPGQKKHYEPVDDGRPGDDLKGHFCVGGLCGNGWGWQTTKPSGSVSSAHSGVVRACFSLWYFLNGKRILITSPPLPKDGERPRVLFSIWKCKAEKSEARFLFFVRFPAYIHRLAATVTL